MQALYDAERDTTERLQKALAAAQARIEVRACGPWLWCLRTPHTGFQLRQSTTKVGRDCLCLSLK